MKHLKSLPNHPLVALAALGSVVVIGCRDAKGPDQPVQEPQAAAASQAAPVPVIDAQQFGLLTNQFALAQKAQLELIQRLQGQVVALEQRNSELGASARSERVEQSGQLKAQEQRVQALLARIGELEEKVGSLQAGKVLPEISVAAVEGPTTLELEQKLKVSDRKRELAEEAAAAAAETQAKTAPKISIGTSGFEFRSGDTNFVLRVRGLVQLDSRTFVDDNPLSEGNDGFSLRRARSIVEGTLLGNIDYQFVSEFGAGGSPAVFDANLNYRINPALQIKAGKFRGPVGLEALQPVGSLLFNERSLVTDMVSARSIGVQLWGSVADDVFSYAAGVFNQSGDGRNPNNNDFNDDREFAGRVFFTPFKRTSVAALERLGFGLGASYSQTTTNALALPAPIGGSLPGYTTPGQQQFFAYNPTVGPVVGEGAHWRLSPQARYLYGPFGLMGEYMITSAGVMNLTTQRPDDLVHTAWQVSGQWVLTGENALFSAIQPQRPFKLGGDGWGAWQLVARYNQLSLDSNTFPSFSNPLYSAEQATSWSVGINWWLNRNLRVMTGFTHTSFEGGGSPSILNVPDSLTAPAVVTTQDENVFSTRVQLSF